MKEYDKLVKRLKKDGWQQQSAGSNWINGNISTNFVKNGMVLSVSLDFWPDDDIIEQLFE